MNIFVKKFKVINRYLNDCFWKYNNKKHLFIHIPKNLGTSIKLNDECLKYSNHISLNMLNKNLISKLFYRDQFIDFKNYTHVRVKDIKKEVINKLKVFCIIRNPWSRCLSKFYYGNNQILCKSLLFFSKL